MIALIYFEICTDAEKNSATIGRMFIICNLKINKATIINAPKTIRWTGQSIVWIEKTGLILLTVPCCCKKIFVIIPRFQKQTP